MNADPRVGAQQEAPRVRDRDVTELGLPVLPSKLSRPAVRPGSVIRVALLERLASNDDAPVVSIRAPAGYGKTTLALQWAELDPRPFTWLGLDAYDNDPTVLLAGIALAVDRIVDVDAALLRSLAMPRYSWEGALQRLLAQMGQSEAPAVLAVDDVHKLENDDSRALIATLVDHIPDGWQLAVVSRDAPWLPLARLRAADRLVECGRDDLAMDDQEAEALVAATGITLDRREVVALNQRTEGWPVALYLAALAIAADPDRDRGAEWPSGTDRFIVEYLQAEVLSLLSASTVEFLTRTSLPHQICGSLCDTLLDRTRSAAQLESLARVNALVIPLDHERRWYRYHHLFREFLSDEVHRREPDLVPMLRRRAADWYEAHGWPDLAVDEAMQIGDVARVGRVAVESAQALYQRGRVTTIVRWFDWLDHRDAVEQYPLAATTGALVHLLWGRAAAAERWIDAAQRGTAAQHEGGAQLEGELAMLRAAACPDGVDRMVRDAKSATRLLRAGSRYRPASLLVLGTAYLVTDEPERADLVLMEAIEAAQYAGATEARVVALTERALLAERWGQPTEPDDLIQLALSVIAEAGFEDYPLHALTHAINGRLRHGHGDVIGAKASFARAQRLRPVLTHALPVYAVQIRLQLAAGYVSLTDVAGARTVLRECGDILRRRPHLGSLVEETARLHEQLDMLQANMAGASSLTSAELRLLPLLATHLSFRQIGERLFISANTVKTEAISIYRKLGVSSRGEAIANARELGLLRDEDAPDSGFIRRG